MSQIRTFSDLESMIGGLQDRGASASEMATQVLDWANQMMVSEREAVIGVLRDAIDRLTLSDKDRTYIDAVAARAAQMRPGLSLVPEPWGGPEKR